MVVLKKIRAASLVETLVASVIIVLVFFIASTIMNIAFKNMIQSDDFELENRMYELHYLVKNNRVTIPYYEASNLWEITIEQTRGNFLLHAVHKLSEEEKEITIYK